MSKNTLQSVRKSYGKSNSKRRSIEILKSSLVQELKNGYGGGQMDEQIQGDGNCEEVDMVGILKRDDLKNDSVC